MSAAKYNSSRRRGGAGSIIALILVVALVVAAGFIFVPRLAHTCDNCGQFFVGTGYYPNVITSTITGIAGGTEKILCLDCATREHALAIAAGASIKDFERPLFELPEEQTDTKGE